jgi:integrase
MRDKLTARQVETIKHGKHADGGGLYLWVVRPGYKIWTFRYMIDGRAREMSLGPVSDVRLARARELANLAREMVRDKRDPLEAKKEARARVHAETARKMTFRQCADAYLTEHLSKHRNDTHRQQWRSSLELASKAFCDIPVADIDTGMVVKFLEPHWRAIPVSASRTRGRIEKVLDWATVHKFREGDNPARWKGHLEHVFRAKPEVKHFEAMPFAEVPAFLETIRDCTIAGAAALEFLILTASRASEVTGAKWEEIDLAAAVWNVPADRMKKFREHTVPLSDRAVELLRNLQDIKSPAPADLPTSGRKSAVNFVFTTADGKKRIGSSTMRKLLKKTAPAYQVHGFRSSFRDWAGDRTNFDRETIEHALAHNLPDKVEAAYRRGTALDKRRRLMAEWARYCEQGVGAADNVLPIRA